MARTTWCRTFGPGNGPAGCDYATLAEINPRLVMCSISAYGQEGPYRDWPAFDLALQAMGGAMSLTGEAGGSPVRMGLPMGDLSGGMFAAFAVAGALLRRSRTGQGAHVDLSLLDCQVSLLGYIAQYFWTDGRVPAPMGSAHASVVPYGALATRDGHLIVAVFERSGPASAGPSGIRMDGGCALRRQRRSRGASGGVMALVEPLFTERGTTEWLERLRAEGVPVAPIQSVDRVLDDRRCVNRRMVVDMMHARTARCPRSAHPSRWTAPWPRGGAAARPAASTR